MFDDSVFGVLFFRVENSIDVVFDLLELMVNMRDEV